MANINDLSEENKKEYRAQYCGMCHSLGKRYGIISKMSLNFDMTFLSMVLQETYGEKVKVNEAKCLPHMIKKHRYVLSEYTDYATDMNIIMCCGKFRDDIVDDNSTSAKINAMLFKKAEKKVSALHKEKYGKFCECLKVLSELEKQGETNPDIPASVFGEMMGEMFSVGEKAEQLYKFGYELGRFVYIMDACCDLKYDLKHEKYNPMVRTPHENFVRILEVIMSECIKHANALGIMENKIIYSILYSGIWSKMGDFNE